MAFGAPEIQGLINAGLGYGAQVIGQPMAVHRPFRPASPLDGSRIGSVMVYFDPDFMFSGKAPNLYGKAVWAGFFDRTATRVGDYLIGPDGTFFIAAMQPLLPTAVVECNATVTITRPAGNTAPGVNPFGGRKTSTDAPLMSGWPASVLLGGRTQAGRADLPADVQDKGFQVLLPAWPGVTLRTSDRLTDDAGRAFTLGAAELTDLGWRLDCVLSVT